MRQDRAASLRERLRKGVSNFEFDALIEGVSNVDEDAAEKAPAPPAATPAKPDLRPASQVRTADSEGLRAALNTLGDRLLQEAGKLAAAFRALDVDESGYHLARINQVLELLHAVDPSGELARKHGTVAAPPTGVRWPKPVWCLYDFAESPLSGLVPVEADDLFCAAVVATAAVAPES
ncbi:MAG: hypothetical protein GX446_18875 [Chthonomonadales bacterium]|nr:hypothetical protein [Chthonomonadales bacterium]